MALWITWEGQWFIDLAMTFDWTSGKTFEMVANAILYIIASMAVKSSPMWTTLSWFT